VFLCCSVISLPAVLQFTVRLLEGEECLILIDYTLAQFTFAVKSIQQVDSTKYRCYLNTGTSLFWKLVLIQLQPLSYVVMDADGNIAFVLMHHG